MLDLGENENRFTPRFLTEIDQALDSITGSSEPAALDVMTTGWRYDAPGASEAGIVDAICDVKIYFTLPEEWLWTLQTRIVKHWARLNPPCMQGLGPI